MKKIEEGRLHAMSFGTQHSGRSYGASPELMAERLPFLGTAQYRFTELFFSTAHYYKPVKFVGKLERIKKSSLISREYLVCDTSDQLLVTSLQSSVAVGQETRRPESHPDWFVEKFKHLSPTNQLFDPYKREITPPGSGVLGSSTYIIAQSDADYNRHSGNNSYIRFCLDAAFQQPEFAKHAKQETELLNTKYIAESNVGDTLSINVWTDEKDESTLRWSVE